MSLDWQIQNLSNPLESLWKYTDNLIFDFNCEYTLIAMNPAAEKYLGIRSTDLPSPLIETQIFGDQIRQIRSLIAINEEMDISFSLPSRTGMLLHEGVLIPNTTGCFLIFYPKRNVAIVGTGLSRKTQSLFGVVLEHAPIVLFSVDENGILTASQGKPLKILGLDPAERIGKSIEELYEDNAVIRQHVNFVLAHREGCNFTAALKGRSFHTKMVPYYENLDFKGLIGVAIDITERVKAESEHDELKNRILRMTAHDIRGSLSGVLCFLDIILEGRFVDSLTEEQNHIFQLMHSSCSQVLTLTRQIAEAQDLQSKDFRLNVKKVSISSFFFEIYEQLKGLAKRKKIKLGLSLDNAPSEFEFDPELMRRAVNNLALNGIEHCREDGHTRIIVQHVPQSNELAISVTDNGQGLNPSTIQELEKDSSEIWKSKRLGRGVGMFIVKRVIELHSGRLSISSQPGKGSEFSIHLPGNLSRKNEAGQLSSTLDV